MSYLDDELSRLNAQRAEGLARASADRRERAERLVEARATAKILVQILCEAYWQLARMGRTTLWACPVTTQDIVAHDLSRRCLKKTQQYGYTMGIDGAPEGSSEMPFSRRYFVTSDGLAGNFLGWWRITPAWFGEATHTYTNAFMPSGLEELAEEIVNYPRQFEPATFARLVAVDIMNQER